MSRTRIKFCGITRPADADAAVRLGADALGLVFDARSPRCVAPAAARALARQLPPFVQTVALFRDAGAEAVLAVLETLAPDLLQFHGRETPEFCAQFAWPYLKAVPMAEPQDLGDWALRYGEARALLLDAHRAGGMGGTGRSFDWSAIPRSSPKPLVLAGGLTPDNVAQAITMARPYAVDVSSGIESAPGIKDPERMRRFIEEVRRADSG